MQNKPTDHDHNRICHEEHFEFFPEKTNFLDNHSANNQDLEQKDLFVPISKENPQECNCAKQEKEIEKEKCPEIPHGDHKDYLFEGKLYHYHIDHYDDHGFVHFSLRN